MKSIMICQGKNVSGFVFAHNTISIDKIRFKRCMLAQAEQSFFGFPFPPFTYFSYP